MGLGADPKESGKCCWGAAGAGAAFKFPSNDPNIAADLAG